MKAGNRSLYCSLNLEKVSLAGRTKGSSWKNRRRGCRSRGWVLHVLGSLSSPRWSALGHGQQHKREEHGMPTLVNRASHTRASLFYESESEAAQSCPTLWDPMGRSPPSSSIHGISQARVLEGVAMSFSMRSPHSTLILSIPPLQEPILLSILLFWGLGGPTIC